MLGLAVLAALVLVRPAQTPAVRLEASARPVRLEASPGHPLSSPVAEPVEHPSRPLDALELPSAPVVASPTGASDAGSPALVEEVRASADASSPAEQATGPERKRRALDDRFGARWEKAGLCADDRFSGEGSRRARLFETFATVRRAGTLVHHDPSVPVAVVDLAGAALEDARRVVVSLLGARADVPMPSVYVYASNEQLRDVACVNNASVVGYYDGAIHLPGDDVDLVRTVKHELVHHVLNALSVRGPLWLHEGLALYAADERWWQDPRLGLVAWLREKHLPFPAMAEAFPHTADPLFAGAAYYQSFQMISFVGQRARRPDFGWLVEGLESGQLSTQRCFEEAVGLDGAALEQAWSAFVQSN